MKVLEDNKVKYVSKAQLASLYEVMLEHRDKNNAEKILDLYEKLTKNEFHVSFTGHFSAGKSSLINYFLGKELLPKSPIPTSANIVKITSGEGVARVFFNEQDPVEYDEPYDIDMIKDYCMSKDTIHLIEIHTSEQIVPENTYVVDTPGIDAADDADRYMTESSLHLVDVLYYVMDYNHVQSEINFTFLKQIQEKNIPIYLIINQVDKHNDKELSFEEFKARVEQSFAQWSIYPENIYYSSVMDDTLPYNELSTIKKDLFHLLHNYDKVDRQVSFATEAVVQSHREYLEKNMEEEKAQHESGDFDGHEWQRLLEQIDEMESKESDLKDEFSEELDQTLKNAYLMPAQLRDLAEAFLESQDPAFKVGFFGAKRKTAEAKDKRMQAFYNELKQSIESTILWRLREKFAEILQAYQIANEELRNRVQDFAISFSEDQLFDSLKPGATVNGNYVLNYTNELSNKIKQACRRQANELFAEMEETLNSRTQLELEPLLSKKERLESLRESTVKQTNLEEELHAQVEKVTAIYENDALKFDSFTEMDRLLENRYVFVKEEVDQIEEKIKDSQIENSKLELASEETSEETSSINLSAEEIVEQINRTVEEISDLPDFQTLIEELRSKKKRIEDRSLTIALFGAFSAGKSSFSNALLGERVLPVSPNPTTAVINRIRPVTEEYQSGTVVISYKTDEILSNDLLKITKDFSPKASNFRDLVSWIKEEKIYEKDALSQVYQSYLIAILAGYEARKDLLGKEEEISLEDFAAYVTEESIAAYIEAVDLYYDNELTQNGITLVDTPGANSVNARHTNVAFDYIKDADAILYVTYYNHAVTSADRDFLIQLGRVKESFELDKMYFIVNAADLAKDEEELNLVVNYVEDTLLQYGIRNPQIYPLSSKLSLEQKENKENLNDQMLKFEERFSHFIEHDLHALTYEAAIWDIKRVQSRLANLIQSARLDEQDKAEEIKSLEESRSKSITIIESKDSNNVIQRGEERIERQLHYVEERLYIRFHDMFQEHFNPTTVTENGRQAQEQLVRNRNRLVDYVGYELLQEVRAVSLRLEAFMNELLKDHYEEISDELLQLDQRLTLANYEEEGFTTPNYEQAFEEINMDLFQKALRVFRNLRSFFEQNEREQMKEAFYEALKPEATKYLQEQAAMMRDSYMKQLDIAYQRMLDKIRQEVEAIVGQQINVLNTDIDYTSYTEKLDKINKIVRDLEA